MTLRDVVGVARVLAAKVAGLAYPPTKQKLHRLFHAAATLVAVASAAGVWLVSNVHWSARLGADLVLLVTYLAKWRAVVGKVDAVVDSLPIPEGDASTVLRLLKDDGRGKA